MEWKIYYDDGSIFSNLDGEANQAPSRGVQAVVFPNKEHGRTILHRFDWYYWKEGEGWWASDVHGMIDQLLIGDISAVKMGRNLSNEKFQVILDKAIYDFDFAPKTGWVATESPTA